MNIIQIIPAEGWFALYDQGETRSKLALACWALVEDETGARRIVGMVSDPENQIRDANYTNFVCYEKPPV